MTLDWKKYSIIAADIAIGVYLLLAMTAFNEPDIKGKVCTQVKIDISESVVKGFLNADEIKTILVRANLYPLGKQLAAGDVREIEETLTGHPFIENAQCYKTPGGHVCISLAQHMPVMRVLADNGDSYYIDNRGKIMNGARFTADIVVATGHISRKYAAKVLTDIGNHIVNDKFWHNQIVQLNVLPDKSIEIVPRVGEHIIYLGQPENIAGKLTRVEKFYKYGLNKVGWNKYSRINVEFDNQIICKKRDSQPHSRPVTATPAEPERQTDMSVGQPNAQEKRQKTEQ